MLLSRLVPAEHEFRKTLSKASGVYPPHQSSAFVNSQGCAFCGGNAEITFRRPIVVAVVNGLVPDILSKSGFWASVVDRYIKFVKSFINDIS